MRRAVDLSEKVIVITSFRNPMGRLLVVRPLTRGRVGVENPTESQAGTPPKKSVSQHLRFGKMKNRILLAENEYNIFISYVESHVCNLS